MSEAVRFGHADVVELLLTKMGLLDLQALQDYINVVRPMLDDEEGLDGERRQYEQFLRLFEAQYRRRIEHDNLRRMIKNKVRGVQSKN